jgi:gas vesicle protein
MAVEDYIKGMIAGGLVGATLGILYAPKSGKETREELSKSAEEIFEKAKEQYEAACEKYKEMTGGQGAC